MKVVVTGGTGFVGSEVTRQLRAAGHEVNLLSRGNIAAGAAACLEIMRASEALIHLIGLISEVRDQTYENVHTKLTGLIVSCARESGVRRFVHMSALGTRPNAVARYHQTKWEAEEIVRASGLEWTIFRPSIIYGHGDGFVNLFARLSRFSPVLPLIGGGTTRFQPISVQNVARCFVVALTKPAAIGKTFDLCGEEQLTLREIVEAVLAATGRRRLKLPLPFGIAELQALVAELVFAKLLSKPPPLNRDQMLMLREDNIGDGGMANKLFQLEHEKFALGIQRFLKPST